MLNIDLPSPNSMKRLAIICSHPIQYYAPLFKLLASSNIVEIKVFYTWGEASIKKHDPGFDKTIEWDIPLLDGYDYVFLNNTAKNPGSSSFWGIRNPTIIREIEKFGPDAILIYGWAYYSHLKTMIHFKNKVPIWFRGDSTIMNKLPIWKKSLRTFFLRWIYKHVDVAFYVGNQNKRYYLRYKLKEDQLVFAPHAIDNVRFSQKCKERELIRKILHISPEEIVVLFAGKLEPIKNPRLLLDAFILANPQKAHLIFLGNGVLEEELKKAAKDYPNIHFIGFQNQSAMPAYYQASDLFCLPSFSETWGLAVNEAMACGKAILASDKVGCAADLICPGHNGEIFESGSLASLQMKLSTLLTDRNVLAAYGENSLNRIKKWSFDVACVQILKQFGDTGKELVDNCVNKCIFSSQNDYGTRPD